MPLDKLFNICNIDVIFNEYIFFNQLILRYLLRYP